MQAVTETERASRKWIWTGVILSAIPIVLLIFSAVMKLLKPPPVLQGFARFGYPESLVVTLGIVELACAVLYAIPRTAVLGAILSTAYLGGAVATNVRIGDPTWPMPAVLGVLLWVGLYLRR